MKSVDGCGIAECRAVGLIDQFIADLLRAHQSACGLLDFLKDVLVPVGLAMTDVDFSKKELNCDAKIGQDVQNNEPC